MLTFTFLAGLILISISSQKHNNPIFYIYLYVTGRVSSLLSKDYTPYFFINKILGKKMTPKSKADLRILRTLTKVITFSKKTLNH